MYRFEWFLEDDEDNRVPEVLRLAQELNQVVEKSGKSKPKKHRDSESKTDNETVKKEEDPDFPIYEIFKKVCDQMRASV